MSLGFSNILFVYHCLSCFLSFNHGFWIFFDERTTWLFLPAATPKMAATGPLDEGNSCCADGFSSYQGYPGLLPSTATTLLCLGGVLKPAVTRHVANHQPIRCLLPFSLECFTDVFSKSFFYHVDILLCHGAHSTKRLCQAEGQPVANNDRTLMQALAMCVEYQSMNQLIRT